MGDVAIDDPDARADAIDECGYAGAVVIKVVQAWQWCYQWIPNNPWDAGLK